MTGLVACSSDDGDSGSAAREANIAQGTVTPPLMTDSGLPGSNPSPEGTAPDLVSSGGSLGASGGSDAGNDTDGPNAAGGSQTAAGGSDSSAGGGSEPAQECYAVGTSIEEVSIWQAVKITLFDGSSPVNDDLTLAAGVDGRIRIGLTEAKQNVTAVVTITSGNTEQEFEVTGNATRTDDADFASTLNLDIPGSAINSNSRISVELFQDDDCDDNAASGYRAPETGTAEMGAVDVGDVKIVIVPIRVGNFLPDTSDAHLGEMKAHLEAIFPAKTITMTTHETITSQSQPVSGPADTNSQINLVNTWLSEVSQLRYAENAPADTVYYGLAAPNTSLNAYCGRSCISGLASQSRDFQGNPILIAGVGLGFTDYRSPSGNLSSVETFSHEIAHCYGLGHANCDVSDADPNYPHQNAYLNVFGFDRVHDRIVDPDNSFDLRAPPKDFMGYCGPHFWISDYHWNRLAASINYINGFSQFRLIGEHTPSARRHAVFSPVGAKWTTTMKDRTSWAAENDTATLLHDDGSSETVDIVAIEWEHTKSVEISVDVETLKDVKGVLIYRGMALPLSAPDSLSPLR